MSQNCVLWIELSYTSTLRMQEMNRSTKSISLRWRFQIASPIHKLTQNKWNWIAWWVQWRSTGLTTGLRLPEGAATFSSLWHYAINQKVVGFETWWSELIFSICLILPNTLGPGVHSASDRNEYQKQKTIMFPGSKARPVRRADKLTIIWESTV
jgi:hypothetical protein